uniref:Cysteine-rich secretory protein LCCL domain-containing 1-like n=1 Tax=Saccoglossus kowalevskii TaxID=10224 RepID=A0ABM0MJA6_SACKO|nr:PREDICTED: cysteine-rich secretory protein LCCL domain-containing 1-like [Saccoglossus kowalevskii]
MKFIILFAVAASGMVSAAGIIKNKYVKSITRARREEHPLASQLCIDFFGANYPYKCSSAAICLYCPGDIGDGVCQVCNGNSQCPNGEDEEGCEDYSEDYGDAGGQCQVPNQSKIGTGGMAVLQSQMLEAHNYFRCLHGAVAMTTSQTAIDDAIIAAANCTAAGTLIHSYPGENLASMSSEISEATGYGLTKLWYDEIADYNYNDPDSSTGVIGHFTQVVWAASTNLGCAYNVDTVNDRVYVACEYEPYGNYIGQYTSNVNTPI